MVEVVKLLSMNTIQRSAHRGQLEQPGRLEAMALMESPSMEAGLRPRHQGRYI